MTDKITMSEACALYRAGNNAGEGYGTGWDDVQDSVCAMLDDGARLVLERNTTDDVAVVQVGDKLVAIGGDAMGRQAWAVTIRQVSGR